MGNVTDGMTMQTTNQQLLLGSPAYKYPCWEDLEYMTLEVGSFFGRLVLDGLYSYFAFEIATEKNIHPRDVYRFLGRRFAMKKEQSAALVNLLKENGFLKRNSKGFKFVNHVES